MPAAIGRVIPDQPYGRDDLTKIRSVVLTMGYTLINVVTREGSMNNSSGDSGPQQLYVVRLPQEVSLEGIEAILRQHYRQSLNKKWHCVDFDCKSVRWFDLFFCSILALWVFELQKVKRTLRVFCPEDLQARSFLGTYGFLHFLESLGVDHDATDSPAIATGFDQLAPAPIYPLTLLNAEHFNKIIQDLRRPERSKIVLHRASTPAQKSVYTSHGQRSAGVGPLKWLSHGVVEVVNELEEFLT